MQADFAAVEDLRLTSEQYKAVGFLAEFTKRMVVFAFPGHKTPTRASDLVKEVHRVTDNMMTGCLKTGAKPSCKTGCFWCCYMRVKVTPLEVLCIVDFLRSCLRPRELSELQLVPEAWGGDTIFGNISAKTGEGVEEFLELLSLQSEILELKENPDKPARGTVVEARLDKSRGPIATVLIKNGTLKQGDCFVC